MYLKNVASLSFLIPKDFGMRNLNGLLCVYLRSLPSVEMTDRYFGLQIFVNCSSRLLEKSIHTGCSKMLRCKAREIMRNEAYFSYAAVKQDERNAADGRFSTAC